jgi:hypothetical protein
VAVRFKPKTYTFISGTPVSIATITGSPSDDYSGNISLRAGEANLGNIYWGDGVDLGGYLKAGEAAAIDLSFKFVDMKGFYLSGSAGDSVYLTLLG